MKNKPSLLLLVICFTVLVYIIICSILSLTSMSLPFLVMSVVLFGLVVALIMTVIMLLTFIAELMDR